MEFETIVETYYSPLYRFGVSLTGSEADASDLTQQTFLIWAEKGDQLRDRSKVKTWLFTTIYREFLRSKQRSRSFPHESLELTEVEIPSQESLPDRSLDGETVMQILQQIEIVYREPLSLFYLQDLSYKEIADILEIPIGTVMSRLARGKSILRKELEKTTPRSGL